MPPGAATPESWKYLEGAYVEFRLEAGFSVADFRVHLSRVDIDAVGRTIGNADTSHIWPGDFAVACYGCD